MQKVEIRVVTEGEIWDTGRERIEVSVDGEYVGGGYYGGEPEDNYRFRQYAWVEELVEALAAKLGAKVAKTKVEEEPE